jgi:hypothetical protein
MVRTICGAALSLLLGVAPLTAQTGSRSTTTGFLLNGHLGAAAGNVEDGSTRGGVGGGLVAGYGITPQWTVFVGGDAVGLDVTNPRFVGDYTLYQGDLGVRLNFPDPTAAFSAYLVGAFTGQLAKGTITGGDDVGRDAELTGWGGTVGTGFHYFLSPVLALDTTIQFTFGQFTHADVTGAQAGKLDNPLQNWVTRVNVGLSWYPQG